MNSKSEKLTSVGVAGVLVQAAVVLGGVTGTSLVSLCLSDGTGGSAAR